MPIIQEESRKNQSLVSRTNSAKNSIPLSTKKMEDESLKIESKDLTKAWPSLFEDSKETEGPVYTLSYESLENDQSED